LRAIETLEHAALHINSAKVTCMSACF